MSDTKYNGWTNYPTWAVHLYLSNTESLMREAQEIARAKHGSLTRVDEAMRDFVTQVFIEVPGDTRCSAMRDFATWAMGEVNWQEIVAAFTGV